MDWWCSALALTDASAAVPGVDADGLLLGAVADPSRRDVYVGGPGVAATRNGRELPHLDDVPVEQACATTYRSEEHTSELQSLMRISYAVFCLKKKNTTHSTKPHHHQATNDQQS